MSGDEVTAKCEAAALELDALADQHGYPGKKGALALVAPDGTLVDVIDMPDATGAAR